MDGKRSVEDLRSPIDQFAFDLHLCNKLQVCSLCFLSNQETLKVVMEKNNLFSPLFEQEMPLIRTILRMEKIGICVDKDYLSKFRDPLNAKMEELSAEAHKLAGHSFLVSSPQQVAKGINYKGFY